MHTTGDLKRGDVLPPTVFATLEESYIIRAKRGDIRVSAYAADPETTWHILQCAPRSEKKLTDRIAPLGFGVYYPIERTWVGRDRRTGKMKKGERPFIGGYLFVSMPPDNAPMGMVKDMDGAVDFVYSSAGRPALLRGSDLAYFRDLEASGALDRTVRRRGRVRSDQMQLPLWIVEGAQVSIKNHPLLGFFAKVLEAARGVIRAETEIFGRITSVELTLDQVEKVA